jgi:FlaG/FlaF family flagellin (archaellin)
MKRLKSNLRAISPVLAVLMMIAVAIAGALLVYAWIMGYIGVSTERAGESIMIPSIANDPADSDLLVYVNNIGEEAVQFEEDECLYVDGVLAPCTISGVTVSDSLATLDKGETAMLRYSGGAALPGEKVKIKVTTLRGTSAEKYAYPAGSARALPTLDHFEFDTIASPQTSGTAFSVTIRAMDQYDELFTGYSGTNTLTYSNGEISPTTTGDFVYGSWTGNVAVTGSATNASVTTAAHSNLDLNGTSNPFIVNPAPSVDHFEFDTIASPQTSGVSFSITIRAIDQYGNLFTGYRDANTLTYSGWKITPSTTGGFTDGVWTGNVTLTGSDSSARISTAAQFNPSRRGTSNTFVVNEAPSVPTETIFEDDFENYSLGPFPYDGDWELHFWSQDEETQDQFIVDDVSVSPTQSFQLLVSTNLGVCAFKQFEADNQIIGYEVYVMVDSLSGWHTQSFRVGFHCGSTPPPQHVSLAIRAGVDFSGIGAITAADQVLMSYNPGVWYKVRVICNIETGEFSVWIDDVLLLEDAVESYVPSELPLDVTAFGQETILTLPTVVHFDNVTVFYVP